MKLFKNKKVVLASAIILGVSAITSSALAAYIITGGNRTGKGTVNHTPIEITNNVVNLQTPVIEEELLLYPTTTVTDGVLKSDAVGNLDVIMKLTLEVGSESTLIPDLVATISFGSGNTSLVDDGYIILPGTYNETDKTSTVEIASSGFNKTSGSSSNGLLLYTQDVTLTWNWGEAFGNTDPCEYFNEGGEGYSEDNYGTVSSKMADFEVAVKAVTSFNISISEKTQTV